MSGKRSTASKNHGLTPSRDIMEKKKLEEIVGRWLGQEFDLTHKGNHRWESSQIETTTTNSGVFESFFDKISLVVQTSPCEGQFKGWHSFRIDLRWNYRNGGTNGTDLQLFYNEADDGLFTHEE